MGRTAELLHKHKWWVALLLVVIAGYSLGKDLALRDNARDRALSGAIR